MNGLCCWKYFEQFFTCQLNSVLHSVFDWYLGCDELSRGIYHRTLHTETIYHSILRELPLSVDIFSVI